MKRFNLLLCIAAFASCTPSVPTSFDKSNDAATIAPDYTSVTIPVNIAPLTFAYTMPKVSKAVTTFTCGDKTLTVGGTDVCPNMKKWHAFIKQAAGKDITVQPYIQCEGEKNWKAPKPFTITVAEEPVDPYITYRLIAPSYVTYEDLTINQRCLENYDESVIFSNLLISTENQGQCINCHTVRNYNPDSLQFHARQHKGGTIMAFNGDIHKINLKTDSTLSAGVYPSWHPTHNYIAYSVNNTGQSFHTRDNEKIEVQDLYSDLILYDIDKNEVTNVENDTTEWECFPWWAPDGKTLYYVSANYYPRPDMIRDRDIIDRYKEFKYDLYKKSFDPDTKHFGPRELVYAASQEGKSVTLPRVSPDGRYLLMTIGDYGVFHIWHRSSDLLLMDLQDGSMRKLHEVNSPDTESFHNWSSNGRWILFSSRRDDGSYTRLYLAYFDRNGHGHKPFIIPQKTPDYYQNFYKSYNIPELMKGPVTIKPQEFAKRINGPTESVDFHEQY